MSETLKQRLFIMITNTVRMIVFAVLAVVFKHWWIVLFSPLFFIYEKDKKDE